MKPSERIRRVLRKFQKKPEPQQGILGNEVGEIAVPNRADYVYVRVAGMGTVAVYNKRVPLIQDLPVDIGYDPIDPKTFQVLNVHRYAQIGGRSIIDSVTTHHGSTHGWMKTDPVYIDKRQYMPLRPTPMGGMNVHIFRDVFYGENGWVSITGHALDLSSVVPATGSLFSLIYVDQYGSLQHIEGVTRDISTLGLSDVPIPYPGTVPIAVARLSGGQTGIYEAYNGTEIVDVRKTVDTVRSTSKTDYLQDINFKVAGRLAVTNNVDWYLVPRDTSISGVILYCDTPGNSGTTEVDVKVNGISMGTGTVVSLPYNTPGKYVETTMLRALKKGDRISPDIKNIAVGASNLSITLVAEDLATDIIPPPIPPSGTSLPTGTSATEDYYYIGRIIDHSVGDAYQATNWNELSLNGGISDGAIIHGLTGTYSNLVGSFITFPEAGIGKTYLPSGTWSFYVGVAHTDPDATPILWAAKLSVRTQAGTETDLITFNFGNAYAGRDGFSYSAELPRTTINPSDRLVIRYYAQDNCGFTRFVTIYVEQRHDHPVIRLPQYTT